MGFVVPFGYLLFINDKPARSLASFDIGQKGELIPWPYPDLGILRFRY